MRRVLAFVAAALLMSGCASHERTATALYEQWSQAGDPDPGTTVDAVTHVSVTGSCMIAEIVELDGTRSTLLAHDRQVIAVTEGHNASDPPDCY